jgi:hypothetical protein
MTFNHRMEHTLIALLINHSPGWRKIRAKIGTGFQSQCLQHICQRIIMYIDNQTVQNDNI